MKKITRLVFIGDSLVATDWYHDTFYSHFFNWTNIVGWELGIEVMNSAKGGDTINNIGTNAQFIPRVIDLKPSHCMLEGGMNDTARTFNYTIKDIVDHMRYCIQTLKYHSIQPLLLWIPADPNGMDNLYKPELSIQVNKEYEKLARYENVPFLNLEGSDMGMTTPNGINKDMKTVDRVHNNLSGHAYIARRVISFFKNIQGLEGIPSPVSSVPTGNLQTQNYKYLNITKNGNNYPLNISTTINENKANLKMKWRY